MSLNFIKYILDEITNRCLEKKIPYELCEIERKSAFLYIIWILVVLIFLSFMSIKIAINKLK